MMTREEALVLLNRISFCHAHNVQLLLDAVGDLGELVAEPQLRSLEQLSPFGKKFANAVRAMRTRGNPRDELCALEKKGVRIVSFWDDAYPANLREIHDPPLLLYVKGTLLQVDARSIAVVGSRRASFYGRETADRMSCELAAAGITIVSGLARGIDTAAHRGAVRGGGRTIAVLGCGVDVVYPAENKDLYEGIALHGAVVSEYPLGTPPMPYNFPRRNRIISGIARGIVVVEATEKSGSLITARLALDEGREVYSLPGRINTPQARGTNNLIKAGARLVTAAEEIIEDMYPDRGISCTTTAEVADGESPSIGQCGEEEAVCKVLNFMSEEPCYLTDVVACMDIEATQVYSIMAHLEVTHKVKRLWGGAYVRASA